MVSVRHESVVMKVYTLSVLAGRYQCRARAVSMKYGVILLSGTLVTSLICCRFLLSSGEQLDLLCHHGDTPVAMVRPTLHRSSVCVCVCMLLL